MIEAERIKFDDFELDPVKRQLSKNGRPIELGSKAFDLLVFLVRRHGSVVSKSELMDGVWPNEFVEENNLTVQISVVRKALDDKPPRLITTVSGKGYSFVGNIELLVGSRTEREEALFAGSPDDPASLPRDQYATIPPTAGSGMFRLLIERRLFVSLAFISIVFLTSSLVFRDQFASGNASGSVKPVMPIKIEKFTTSGGIPHRAAISPDGKHIVYVQRLKERDSIWVGDRETRNSVEITTPSERLLEFISFSPDGRSILFTGRDEDNPDWTLYSVSMFGGPVRRLIDQVHSAWSFSRADGRIAFVRKQKEGRTAIMIADPDGENEDQLAISQPNEPFNTLGVSWSPDGNSIAFGLLDAASQRVGLAKVDRQTRSITRIGKAAWKGRINAVWKADGTGIYVLGREELEPAETQLWFVNASSGEAKRVTQDTSDYHTYNLSVSEYGLITLLSASTDSQIWTSDLNGKDERLVLAGSRSRREGHEGIAAGGTGRIFYTATVGTSQAIWAMNADGTDHRQITPSAEHLRDSQISLTKDERHIVFQSNRSGSSEIWRIAIDGSGLTQLTTGGGNAQPAIVRDDNSIVFVKFADTTASLWQMSFDGSELRQISEDDVEWPTVSPDGKYVAAAMRGFPDRDRKKIRIYDLVNVVPLQTIEANVNAALFNRVKWSPDSKHLICKDIVRGVWKLSLDTGISSKLAENENRRVFHFDFSPDSKRVVYSGGELRREVVILNTTHL
ncbi:MAG: winged helix-turn-helix domain-containing protein [Acidobacteria bacterium]|nr:winged helix-turn-helix domain-containing protein [Acidobacteriota bacterium]